MDSMEKNEPFFITRHIVEIAKAFNKFYTNSQIVVEDKAIREARLMLTYGVKTTIINIFVGNMYFSLVSRARPLSWCIFGIGSERAE